MWSFDDAWQIACHVELRPVRRRDTIEKGHYASSSAIGTEAIVAEDLHPSGSFCIYAIINMAVRLVSRSQAAIRCRIHAPCT
jgi:hypothetical protein